MTASSRTVYQQTKSASSLVEICSVRLGETCYGVPIAHIIEIVASARPQSVPRAPDFVGGLIHYRGDVLTTVSLRRLLGLPPRDCPQDILVLEGGEGSFGLLVDSVMDVLAVCPEAYEPNPSTLDEAKKSLFGGAFKLTGSLLIMLNPERLDPLRLSASQPANGD